MHVRRRTLSVASIFSPCFCTNLAVFSTAWCCFLLLGKAAALASPICDARSLISAGMTTSSCSCTHMRECYCWLMLDERLLQIKAKKIQHIAILHLPFVQSLLPRMKIERSCCWFAYSPHPLSPESLLSPSREQKHRCPHRPQQPGVRRIGSRLCNNDELGRQIINLSLFTPCPAKSGIKGRRWGAPIILSSSSSSGDSIPCTFFRVKILIERSKREDFRQPQSSKMSVDLITSFKAALVT